MIWALLYMVVAFAVTCVTLRVDAERREFDGSEHMLAGLFWPVVALIGLGWLWISAAKRVARRLGA
jgi:hypothetical protein